jgi:hypothetical protein
MNALQRLHSSEITIRLSKEKAKFFLPTPREDEIRAHHQHVKNIKEVNSKMLVRTWIQLPSFSSWTNKGRRIHYNFLLILQDHHNREFCCINNIHTLIILLPNY